MQVNDLSKSISYNPIDTQNSGIALSGKIAGVKTDNESHKTHKNQQQESDVEISNDAMLISSRKAEAKSSDYKAAGSTSKREAWENDSTSIKKTSRYDHHSGEHTIGYMFQTDEPDTYAKYYELACKAEKAFHKEVNGMIIEDRSFNNKEAWDLYYESNNMLNDWFNRKCMNTGTFVDPIKGKASVIDSIEKKYSDIHDLSINIYATEGQDEIDGRRNQFSGASLWKYSTKYNMLMSADMLKQLVEGTDKEKQQLQDIIDESMKKLKEAEKNYEGDKVFLRFGVKFHEDGNVTYHANYKDCEDDYGIQANSAEELLSKLMKNEI